MIKITDIRYKSYGEVYPSNREQDLPRALYGMLKHEIGFGGTVQDITDTKVVIKTRVLDCVDVVTYEGNADEMKLLMEAAYYSAVNNPFSKGIPEQYKNVVLDRVMEATKGNPLFIKLGAGFITGSFTLKATLVTMIGAVDEETMKKLFKIDTDTLISILTLVRIDNVSIEDALELAMLEPVYGFNGKITAMTSAVQ